VEDDGISDSQLIGINDNLAGIVDNGVQCQAPALMADYAFTVLTSRFGVVAVAMIRDWVVVRHISLGLYQGATFGSCKFSPHRLLRSAAHQFNSLTKSIRIDNAPNRTIGLSATMLYKQRMISST
jgi:hypothetical protein